MKKKVKTAMQEVLESYPEAKQTQRPSGKVYVQIVLPDGTVLGQGINGRAAWKSANRNINGR